MRRFLTFLVPSVLVATCVRPPSGAPDALTDTVPNAAEDIFTTSSYIHGAVRSHLLRYGSERDAQVAVLDIGGVTLDSADVTPHAIRAFPSQAPDAPARAPEILHAVQGGFAAAIICHAGVPQVTQFSPPAQDTGYRAALKQGQDICTGVHSR